MNTPATDPRAVLYRSLANGRIHSAYLLSGAGKEPRETAEWFARALACRAHSDPDRPCEKCPACAKSRPSAEPVALDAKGKKGPAFRHVGEHPDLIWVERAGDATRVALTQIRGVQHALSFGANEGGHRVAVIADAEQMSTNAANGLLKLLEEPPPSTTLLLVTRNATSLLTTIRSRCMRVMFPTDERVSLRDEAIDAATGELVSRLDGIDHLGLPDLLDWAEEYRGARAVAAAKVETLLATARAWLHERTAVDISESNRDVRPLLDAFSEVGRCQRDLTTRNANPQMVAERSLFAVRSAVARR